MPKHLSTIQSPPTSASTEKKALNAINRRPYADGGCRFPVLEAAPAPAPAADGGQQPQQQPPQQQRRVKARIQTAPEKIQILVRWWGRSGSIDEPPVGSEVGWHAVADPSLHRPRPTLPIPLSFFSPCWPSPLSPHQSSDQRGALRPPAAARRAARRGPRLRAAPGAGGAAARRPAPRARHDGLLRRRAAPRGGGQRGAARARAAAARVGGRAPAVPAAAQRCVRGAWVLAGWDD